MSIEINAQFAPRAPAGAPGDNDGLRWVSGSLSLVAGTKTQNIPAATVPGGTLAGQLFVSRNAPGGMIGDLSIVGVVNVNGSVDVTVTSANAGDTSDVSWALVFLPKRP